MISPYCARAIEDALQAGNALLKFISRNDLGITGSHQYGFYLPKSVWEMYSPHPPVRGHNAEHEVTIIWPDGRATDSRVKWYGSGTRSEYRLTRFGRDFPWLDPDNLGDLLVLIPQSHTHFAAYVLHLEEDIEEIQAVLGVTPFDHWGVYRNGAPQIETVDECIEREFRRVAASLTTIPEGRVISAQTTEILQRCLASLRTLTPDEVLLKSYETEYQLFQLLEGQVNQERITGPFQSIKEFLKVAASIMNARKARAGNALEYHVEYLLNEAGLPHKMQPHIDGNPDIVIPSEEAYNDPNHPDEKLFIVGLKTSLKERWAQVLNEGRRVPKKHILTLERTLPSSQLRDMHTANITLIVPEPRHAGYPPDRDIEIMSLDGFFASVRERLNQ